MQEDTNSLKTSTFKIKPKAFAIDERLQQGLVIFETVKSGTTFSISLGPLDDVINLIKDGPETAEGPFKLTKKVFEEFHVAPKKASIDKEGEITLFLKQKQNKRSKKLNLSVAELLGLWNVYDFPIFSSQSFIDNSREKVLETNADKFKSNPELYKRYGQKYLM